VTVQLTLSERLRLAGQWLDATDALTAELSISPDAMQLTAVDGEGEEQSTVLTRWELAKLSAHARSLRRNPWDASTVGWSTKLRTLGQLLERQEAEPVRIWGGADQLQVSGARESEPVSFICRNADLEEWDRTQRAPRVLRALRDRVRPGARPTVPLRTLRAVALEDSSLR
jgi:hypothetical protein